MFSNEVLGLAKTLRSSFTWNKKNIHLNCEGTRFLEKIFVFKNAPWTLNYFWISYLGSLRMVIKCSVISEIENSRRFEGTTISKTNLILGFLRGILIVTEMLFWAHWYLFIKNSSKIAGDETSFWCEFAEQRKFQKAFWFSAIWDGNIQFDCFHLRFSGSATCLFSLLIRVHALEILFHGPAEPCFAHVICLIYC